MILLLGTFIIYGAFVATEFFGIHKKIQGLVIFNFIIRVLLSILNEWISYCIRDHPHITSPPWRGGGVC